MRQLPLPLPIPVPTPTPVVKLPDRLMTIRDVMEFTSLSKAQIDRLVRDGEFPEPIYISQRRRVRCPSHIQQWLDGLLTSTVPGSVAKGSGGK